MKLICSKFGCQGSRIPHAALVLGYAIALAFCTIAKGQQGATTLVITSPTDGATVPVGQSVNIVVSASTGSSFQAVEIVGESLGSSQVLKVAPFSFTLAIPPYVIGPIKLTALGVTTDGSLVSSDSITIDCESTSSPASLTPSVEQVGFLFAGEQFKLGVTGAMTDGSQLNLSRSSKTAYFSSNTAVASVDPNGLITAIGPGSGVVSVSNGGQIVSVPVIVPNSLKGDLNADGNVNTDDLNIILASLNTASNGAFDARDLNGDGLIDIKDVQAFPQFCTLPGCTTSSSNPAAPQIVFSPTSLPLGSQSVLSSSSAKTITIINSGTATLTIQNIAIAGEFTQTNTCSGSIAPLSTCLVNIVFSPTAAGLRSGTLSVTDNAGSSPQVVGLDGTGMLLAPAITVTPTQSTITTVQPLTVTARVDGGTGNPTPTGSVILSSGSYNSSATTLSNGSASINVPSGALSAGLATLTVTYAPDVSSSATYTSTSNTATVTVTKLTPIVTVTPGQSSITTAQALAVTVAVSGGTGNPTSTGSVTLTSGSYTSAATALSSGSATINIPAGSLATGTDTLSANYAGDGNYVAKTGTNAVTVTVPQPPGFTVSGTAVTVSRGATTGNTSTITVTPSGGFTGSVALSAAVTSSPTGAQYPPTLSFGSTSPVSITGATAGTATLTIATTAATSGSLSYPKIPGVPWYATGGATLACILLLGIPARRRTWRRILGILAFLFVLVGGVSACGGKSSIGGGGTGNPGTTAGTYTVTVTGVSGSLTQAGTLVVTVN